MASRTPGRSPNRTSRARTCSSNGPFLPGAPVWVMSMRPPNASSETVMVFDDDSSDQGETDSRADSIVKRVGFPVAGLVRTRMS